MPDQRNCADAEQGEDGQLRAIDQQNTEWTDSRRRRAAARDLFLSQSEWQENRSTQPETSLSVGRVFAA